jgi:PAS domain S-box-containing protein
MEAASDLIRLSDAYLSSRARVTSIGIFHTTVDRHVTHVNARCLEILGSPAESHYERDWLQLLHPDDRQHVLTDWLRTTADDVDCVVDCRIVQPSGALRDVHIRLAPVVAPGGERRGFVGTVEDFSNGHHAERTVREVVDAREQYVKRLEILAAIDRAILAARSPTMIADAAVRAIGQLFPAIRVSLSVFDHERNVGEVIAVWSQQPSGIAVGYRFSLDDDKAALTREGRPDIVADITAVTAPSGIDDMLASQGVRSYMRIPLRTQLGVVGSLNISFDAVATFTDEDPSIAQEVADRLAVAIRNAQLVEQLQESSRELSSMSRNLVQLQEQERRDFARELHDEVGQVLTALKLRLDIVRSAAPRELATLVAQAEPLVGDLMVTIRRLVLNLRPPLLDEFGLAEALRAHCERFQSQTGVQVTFSTHGLGDTRLSTEVESAAFRVVQESLTNVARHAGIRRAGVEIALANDALHVRIVDEGRGFDPQEATWNAGLSGMSERMKMLGASFQVQSRPAHGTTIAARIPVRQAAS